LSPPAPTTRTPVADYKMPTRERDRIKIILPLLRYPTATTASQPAKGASGTLIAFK
jgi:hypothetical protein